VIICINNSSIQRSKLIVIDFTLEDAGNAVKDNFSGAALNPENRSIVRNMRPEVKKQQSEIRHRLAIKESRLESMPLPTHSIEHVVSTETQVPVVTRTDETLMDTTRGFTIQGSEDTSGKDQRETVGGSIAEGGGIGGVRTDTSEVSGGGIGKADYGDKIRYLRANFTYIRDMIQKKVVYPTIARKMGWEGKVTVSFVIFSDGLTKDLRVMRSSSVEVLDKSAIEAVKDASPFPKPPAEAQIIIPIVYKLN
jgi:protein TonB